MNIGDRVELIEDPSDPDCKNNYKHWSESQCRGDQGTVTKLPKEGVKWVYVKWDNKHHNAYPITCLKIISSHYQIF